MARITNLNGVIETVLPIHPKLPNMPNAQKTAAKIFGIFQGNKPDNLQLQENPLHVTRRLATLSIASIALIGSSCNNGVSFAVDNGLWREIPLPVPSVDNNIGNEKTGSRSFLNKRIYMANIGIKGSMRRIKRYAFDLLAMEDLIGPDTLNYVRRYLTLKSSFIFYDFDKVITAAPVDDKQPLTDLANRLFDNFEKLDDASRRNNLPDTVSSYADTKVILQEVMDRMA